MSAATKIRYRSAAAVLLLAILLELRMIAPFVRQLMANEIKIGLYHEAARQRRAKRERPLAESRLFDMSVTHLNLKNHRTVWAPYKFYLHAGRSIGEGEWKTEVRYYERRRRLIFLTLYAPIALGMTSLLASIAALSFDKPPGAFAIIVLPGIVGLALFFCVTFVGIVQSQSAGAKKAAWQVLSLTGNRPAIGDRPDRIQ